MYREGSPEANQGHAGEAAVRRWLSDQGFFVLRAADISGGAPLLEGAHSGIIVPDLMASMAGHSRWVEVKAYGTAVFFRNRRQWRHGVNLKNWYDYLEVERQSGLPGFLVILELNTARDGYTPLLLMQSMQRLHASREQEYPSGKGMRSGPQVFFARDSFDWYNGPDNIEPFNSISPRSLHTLTQPPPPTARQLGLGL